MKKIVTLLFLLILIGCSKTPESQKTFESIMNTLQSGNSNEIVKNSNEVFTNNPFEESFFEQAPFYLEHFKKIKYKIIEVKEEKETSTIKVSIEAPDLFDYAPDIFQKLISLSFSGASEEMINKTLSNDFLEILKNKELKYTNKELTLNMIKKDGKWVFDNENPDFIKFGSILFGGLDKMGENGNSNNENEKVETKFFKKGERGVLTLTAQTVSSVEIIQKAKYHTIKEGNELLLIKLIKENISDKIVPGVDKDEYQIETKDGTLIKPATIGEFTGYNYDDLPVGNKVEQILVYELPIGQAKNLVIIDEGIKYASYDLGL